MNLVIGLILVLSLTAVFLFFRSTEILSVAKKRISDSFEDGNIEFLVETPWGKFQAASKIESEFNLYNLFLTLPYYQFINGDCEDFFAEVENLSLPLGRLNKIEILGNELPVISSSKDFLSSFEIVGFDIKSFNSSDSSKMLAKDNISSNNMSSLP